jgi:hypothetical protein
MRKMTIKKATCIFLAAVMCLALCTCVGCGQLIGLLVDHTIDFAYEQKLDLASMQPDYDKQDLQEMLDYIGFVAAATENSLNKELKTLENKIGDAYETYDANREAVPAAFSGIQKTVQDAYGMLQPVAVDTYRCIAAQGLEDYDTWNEATKQVYDALDDAYDDIFENQKAAHDHIFDVCDALIKEAWGDRAHNDVEELGDEMIEAYAVAVKDADSEYWEAWEAMDDTYWRIWEGFNSGNADVDALLAVEKEAADGENFPDKE